MHNLNVFKECTSASIDSAIMALSHSEKMEFMTEQLQQQWNSVFAEESENGPNGDSFQVEVTNLFQSKIVRRLDYKVFYSDPHPLFEEHRDAHILTVKELAAHQGIRKMKIRIHFGETPKWSYEGMECLESKRREVSRMFLDKYRRWNLDKLFAFGVLRDRRQAIGLSRTKAGRDSPMHELPKDVLELIMRLM